MRIHLTTTPNTQPVPFNYQAALVGALHKWLGPNPWHDELSLYSLSWLSRGKPTRGGLNFPQGASLFISSPDADFIEQMVMGLFKGHAICWGMAVEELRVSPTPDFGPRQRFRVQSPVLIKRSREHGQPDRYYFREDPEANALLTETLQRKLAKAGLPQDVRVGFDPDYPRPVQKKVQYRQLGLKGTLCPVVVEGHPRAVQFAWEVGVGNSTGIGFGALA